MNICSLDRAGWLLLTMAVSDARRASWGARSGEHRMGFLTPKQPDPPPAPPPAPTREDPDVEQARRQATVEARRQRGRAATVLTGGQGVTDQAPLRTKRLLGA